MEKWLLLTDYASKYRISVSTLRRRIKAGAQAHRFEAGRYYLPDQYEPIADVTPPMNQTVNQPMEQVAPRQSNSLMQSVSASANSATTAIPTAVLAAPLTSDEPLITTTSKLLNELKQAYTLILHEKEEQIIYLKEEIADLKTLVRVLESDNARLRKTPAGNA
ncbi:MAG: hypothetical protein U1E10_17495 [Bdellovibrionales bacterium]|nr:hypothetical protein [Bdellovibrionales bacterium]